MTVAPLIAMKSTKCESLEAVGKELDRRAHTYANDVDQSGRHIGYCCRADDAHPLPLDKAVERRMGELNTKRKIRDNAVRAMGFIVSSNDALDEKSAREFLDRSINWFGARYGYENLLAAQIHLDEGTPHAHIWVAPVIHDRETGFDRLCAKELFAPDKRRKNAEGKWEVVAQGTMSRLQEDFWEQVAKPYGYERPLRHELRAKGYRSLDAYKVQVGTTRALKSEIETLEGARDKAKHGAITAKRELDEKAGLLESARAELASANADLASARAQLAECKVQVEGFAARFERIKAELAQIAECLSVRRFLGSFKAKLAEFAENPICKAALAAGRDFMTARDGRRAEKVLVNGAREKVAEMEGLSREMGEWSLSDEAGDMRGARRELDGHEAPARPLDNQVL